MTTSAIFKFEFWYQARRPATWIYFIALLFCTFVAAGEPVQEYARADGSFMNGPFIVAVLTLFGSTLGLLVAAGVTADAASRDAQTRMDPLVFTAPLSKGAYVGGRFLAALGLNAMLLSAVPLALLSMAALTSGKTDIAAPFRLATYVAPYLTWQVPNLFVATAVMYSFAALMRRGMMSYLGALLLIGICGLSWGFIARASSHWTLGAFLDPFGAVVLDELSMRWTPAERRTELVPLAGALLWNRLLWIVVGMAALAFTYSRFHFSHRPVGRGRTFDSEPRTSPAEPSAVALRIPRFTPRFGVGTRTRQLLAVAGDAFAFLMKGWGGPAVVLVAAFLVYSALPIAHLGVPLMATTERLVALLAAPLTRLEEINAIVVPLLIVFAAGELTWRERESRLNDIADAAPVPDWMFFVGQLISLGLILATVQGLLCIGGIALQLRTGDAPIELGLYAKALFGLQLVDTLLFGVLALTIHALVNHKYVGHLASVVVYLFIVSAPTVGVRHRLLIFGSDPGWSYSDMRGFDPFVGPWLWVKSYWIAWAIVITLVAILLRVRGTESSIRARLGRARRGLTGQTMTWLATAAMLAVAAGGVVFYHTNILNAYEPPANVIARRAEYEQRYGQYRDARQPRVAGHVLTVDVYPRQRRATIRGTFTLVNDRTTPISVVHVAPRPMVRTTELRFDRPATAKVIDARLSHHIYELVTPLAPGETTRLDFQVTFESGRFANDGIDSSIVANGTALAGDAWLPAIGYQPGRELQAAAARQAHGLPARPMVAVLENETARADVNRGARLSVEATVSTDADQVAVAPGRLLRTWTTNGRRYFRYATDAPIRNDYVLFSAAYAVREARWNEVTIQVLHHPTHAANVDRMIGSVRASLDYFTGVFGPYPHGQLRLVERPGGGVLLHASPINIYYEEPFALLNPDADERAIDLAFAVVAHEVAHQWWGNTLVPAEVEGAALLTETLAWDAALAVVERTHGKAHRERLLAMMRDVYLTPRSYAQEPLLRATDPFLAYRKGPFAMHALRELIGSKAVNAALKQLLDKHASGAPPLATSLDLYRELEAVTPADVRPMLADLFVTNTFWDVAVREARAELVGPGQWQVTIDVDARKVTVGTNGTETDVPMDDQIAVGAFGVGAEPVLHSEHRRVRTGRQRISFTTPFRPSRAGIDPQHLLIDTNGNDNVRDVVVADGPPA
jgi:ABC-2 type transport system permease protein